MTLEHHPSRRWLRPVTVLGLFVGALAAWTFYLTQAELAVFNDPEGNAMQKWTTWLGVPLAGVLTIVLAHWSLSASAAISRAVSTSTRITPGGVGSGTGPATSSTSAPASAAAAAIAKPCLPRRTAAGGCPWPSPGHSCQS